MIRKAILPCITVSSLLTLAVSGCSGAGNQPQSAEDAAALASLSPEERPFVGRWQTDMDKLVQQIKSKGKTNDTGMGLAMADTFFFDIDADHTLVWTGGRLPAGWSLANGRIALSNPGGGHGFTISRRGDALCVHADTGEELFELKRVTPGKPLDPAAVAGEWTLDTEASVKASLEEFNRTAAMIEAIAGKPLDQYTPTEQDARNSLRSLAARGGDSLVFTPGASPGEGSVRMGTKSAGESRPYEVYKDLLLLRIDGGGPGKAMLIPTTVTDGALLWKTSGSAMVYRKK